MANPIANLDYIQTQAGVTPSTDDTNFFAQNYTASNGIRFRKGIPEKKGGFTKFNYQMGQSTTGAPRAEYSTEINGAFYTLIGTSTRLYALIGSVLTNITPFLTSSTAAANSLSTLYGTLANDPISTIINSNIVTVQDASASRLRVGDPVTFSGSNAVGGILAAAINAAQVVHTVSSSSYTFIAATAATSTVASGGGNSVVRKTGLIRCTITNTLSEGDRVKIATALAVGGVTALQINLEFIVRNVTGSVFDFMTAGIATSSASGGGAGTVFYPPIAAGSADEHFGVGYGMGKYGVGLYGFSKTSATLRSYPQIWFFDRFGDFIMMTPGNQGGLYEWSGDITLAPVLTTNAPTKINYMFVTENTIVVFGNNGVENRITACDQGNRTVWSGTAQNQFFDGTQSGAARFISHINLQGVSLIFTEKQAYTFRQIGLPNVWEVKKIANVGIISSMAGYEINGVAEWAGLAEFYRWSGGQVEVVPSNVAVTSSILNTVFQNINTSQKSKSFCWFNQAFQEWRFHYPSASSNEPDTVACHCVLDDSWWPDTESRTAAERPATLLTAPRLLDINGVMYLHDNGTDADTLPLSFSLTTNLRTLSKKETLLSAFIPDSIQTTGDINVHIDAFQWPQELPINSQDYVVPVGQGRFNFGMNGRFWQYTISGSALGQFWRMGKWGEEKQISGDGA